jgi:hypothetical protein
LQNPLKLVLEESRSLANGTQIDGLASETRPGLAQAALAMARILDNPRAVNQQPAAAKVLRSFLDELRSAAARRRRGSLAAVRSISKKGGA